MLATYNGQTSLDLGAIAGEAAAGGHREMVLDLIRLGASDLENIAYRALSEGHVQLAIEIDNMRQ